MLVALGFLIAALLGLLVGSALWSRAVRLTTRRIKASMPVSESEIVADRDRMRADFAIRVHKLEVSLERAKLERARQFIEVNKRDARIGTLETSVGDLRAELEEHINARRVLEQTVSDRLPRVEARLAEAKRLLFNRDREIAELTAGARRHKLALEEASSLTQRQSLQIEKLSSALSSDRVRKVVKGKGAKDDKAQAAEPEAVADAVGPGAREASAEGDAALRAELDALRAEARAQADLAARLQEQLDRSSAEDKSRAALEGEVASKASEAEALRRKLAAAEEALAAVRSATSEADAARIAFEGEIQALKAKGDDQAAEIARLSAELQTFKRLESPDRPVKDSKMVLKARLGSAQAQSDQQAATIGRLRAELAATHERLARQAEHFMDEMRRIKQAQISGATQSSRSRSLRLAEESLAERVAHVRPLLPAPKERRAQVQELASQIKRAQVAAKLQADAEDGAAPPPAGSAPQGAAGNGSAPARDDDAGSRDAPGPGAAAAAPSAAELPNPPPIVAERRRPRLLERLSGLAKG